MNDFTRGYMRGYKDAQKEALMSQSDGAQPEQHQDWCASLTQLLMSMPPKPAPCNCKPPQRKPLTDAQIGDIAAFFYPRWQGHEGFARAIEAAHGIKEKNTRNGGCL